MQLGEWTTIWRQAAARQWAIWAMLGRGLRWYRSWPYLTPTLPNSRLLAILFYLTAAPSEKSCRLTTAQFLAWRGRSESGYKSTREAATRTMTTAIASPSIAPRPSSHSAAPTAQPPRMDSLESARVQTL